MRYARALLISAIAGIAIALSCGVRVANATVFEFTFTDTISAANTPGISVGDTFTLHLFLDNGGSSLISQSWTAAQTMGFTINAGSYSATYSTVWQSLFDFETDASGNVSVAQFFGTEPTSNNTDNFGSWTADTVFGNAIFDDFFGRENFVAAGAFTDPDKWTLAAVPEPTTIALLGIALVGLGVTRRKRA